MIRAIDEKDITECVKVIWKSLGTVAQEFGFTVENAPRFTAFVTTKERLDGSCIMSIGIVEENKELRA